MALKMALNERFGFPLPSTNPPAFPVSPVTTLTEQELADTSSAPIPRRAGMIS
jgi:hypothetical protein